MRTFDSYDTFIFELFDLSGRVKFSVPDIRIHQIYKNKNIDGYRVLVDRLWPRGISKENAKLDDWWKDLTPSPALRKWFGHSEERYDAFKMHYIEELEQNRSLAIDCLASVKQNPLLLLYGAKSPTCNHAIVLQSFLKNL